MSVCYRKVYLGAIVLLVSTMRQGPTPRRVREVSVLFDVDESTIARWQVFWRERFPQTPFWKVARAGLVTLGEMESLPCSLVDAFLRRGGVWAFLVLDQPTVRVDFAGWPGFS